MNNIIKVKLYYWSPTFNSNLNNGKQTCKNKYFLSVITKNKHNLQLTSPLCLSLHFPWNSRFCRCRRRSFSNPHRPFICKLFFLLSTVLARAFIFLFSSFDLRLRTSATFFWTNQCFEMQRPKGGGSSPCFIYFLSSQMRF